MNQWELRSSRALQLIIPNSTAGYQKQGIFYEDLNLLWSNNIA